MTEVELLVRLHTLLDEAARVWGDRVDPLDEMAVDLEVYPVGPSGVLAFFGDYVLAAWPPEERRPASRDAYVLLWGRLRERGFTRHMVHPRNFSSIKVTRKLGAEFLGYDDDGYCHYILTQQAFEERHRGKEESAPQGT